MMNTTGRVRVFINGEDYSDFVVEGSISDESAYSTSIITSTGSLKLAGSSDVLDYNKTQFPIGSHVSIYVTLSNGKMAKLPRGSLLVLESRIDIIEPSITFELGCTLNYLVAREANYKSQIADLIQTFIPEDVKKAFVIEETDIATLNNLLDISGLIIFQNAYGTIQKAKKFGNDGLGSSIDSAKLVSFDKFTTVDVESIGGAIEELPSSILVNATTEIPSNLVGSDDATADGKPPPFVTSSTTRTIKVPDAAAADPFFNVRNIPSQPEAQTEAIPDCGSVSDPDGNAVTYGYTVTGSVYTIERNAKEVVTSGSYTSYEGPGNQVDYEYDFEHCSAGTYAGPVLRAVVNTYVNAMNSEKGEAQALAGKANQALQQRDDFNSREQTVVYFYEEDENGNRTLTNQELSAEGELNANGAEYYACIAGHYLFAADDIADGAQVLGQNARSIADGYRGQYGYSNFNITYYFYDDADAVIEKITKNFIHPASSQAAQKASNSLAYSRTSKTTDLFGGLRYYRANGAIDYSPFRDAFGKSFSDTISGNSLITAHTDSLKDPAAVLNLFLAQTTVTTYEYSDLYVKEKIQFTDHEEPLNSYVKINYSSTGSKNPVEPDRIEIKRDADGNIYSSTNSQNTKSEELEYRQALKLTGTTTNVQSSWLGQPGPQEKVLNLPIDFAPIVKKFTSSGTAITFDPQSTLSNYKKILERYAKNEAKKIAADNCGFRITEVGTRAELFGYYPFYPISLNLSKLGKRYGLRAASSSWVFDSENVLCSIDCFRTSEITTSVSQDDISPFVYTVVIKNEGATTVTTQIINPPATAVSIKIVTLPQSGLLTLSGASVAVGDIITISDIQANNLVYTPLTNNTTQVSFTFNSLDTNGNQIGSGDNIYPTDLYAIPDNLFADAGEFTNNLSAGGVSGDAGDFDLGTRPGGNFSVNAGDFDTGAKVTPLEPQPSAFGALQNGEADVESDYGTNVVDADETTIATASLPAPSGDDQGLLQVEIDFRFKTFTFFAITTEVIRQLGWDYGFIVASLGTDIDNGTVTNPISYNLDFGTIETPIEPALSSSVS